MMSHRRVLSTNNVDFILKFSLGLLVWQVVGSVWTTSLKTDLTQDK